VRPQEFAPWPAPDDRQTELANMQQDVCRDYHGPAWTDDHFAKFDKLVAKGLLDPKAYFRTPLLT
jgi:hypothetical protein